MIADGLTKALGKQAFLNFRSQTSLVDLESTLRTLIREQELKEKLQSRYVHEIRTLNPRDRPLATARGILRED